MSILMVRVVPQGIIFGADRNVTETRITKSPNLNVITITTGQTQKPKVMKWPNKKAIIGYTGVATIANIPTEEWLYDFIGRNLEFTDFSSLANKLKDEVEKQRKFDEGPNDSDALLIHLGGFEERYSKILPTIWFIRNPKILKKGRYSNITKDYLCDNPFWQELKLFDNENNITQIQIIIKDLAEKFNPFGFQQGIDVDMFNMIEGSTRMTIDLIEKNVHPDFSTPQTLEQWKQFMKWSILTYGAFYETYNPPGEKYVGGGADIEALEWPKE